MLLLTLLACTSHNAVITLVPSADVGEVPLGAIRLLQRQSDVSPDTDEADRRLGTLGFGGSLEVTLSQGVRTIDAMGDFLSHPGCEGPAEPDFFACSPSGWTGFTSVEVLGPDWAPGDGETSEPIQQIAEGDVGEIVITVHPSCVCND